MLGGRDPFQQGSGEPLDMAQAAGTAQRRELRPLFVVRRGPPRAVQRLDEVLRQPVGQQAAGFVRDGEVLLEEVGVVDAFATPLAQLARERGRG